MKRQVLFIQGGGERVHEEWDLKLVESLRSALGPTYDVRYPRMPGEADPSYTTWKVTIERQIAALRDGAILVGHSIGGTILIHALAEQPSERTLGAIILVAAPFVGEGGWPAEDWTPQRELGRKLPVGVPVCLYYGGADDTVPPEHVDLYAKAIPDAQVIRVRDRDHQFNNDLAVVATMIKSLQP